VKRDETTGQQRALLDGKRVFETVRRCSGTAITIRLGFTWASQEKRPDDVRPLAGAGSFFRAHGEKVSTLSHFWRSHMAVQRELLFGLVFPWKLREIAVHLSRVETASKVFLVDAFANVTREICRDMDEFLQKYTSIITRFVIYIKSH